MNRRLRLSLLLFGVLAGAFGGRLLAHEVGERFTLPLAPNSTEWRVISAGLQEGIGRTGAGRITHVADGALNIATHVFFRPDVVTPLIPEGVTEMWIELAPDSGPLWVQVGEPPGQFVKLRPGAMLVGRVGADWVDVGDTRRFQLAQEAGELWLRAGEQQLLAGPIAPGRLEFSAVDAWARLTRLQVFNAAGEVQFDADFRGKRIEWEMLNRATVLGAVAGLALATLWVPITLSGVLLGLGLLMPVMVTALQARSVWLAVVERLYLSQVPPSQMASFFMVVAVIPLCGAAVLVHMRALAQRRLPRGSIVWLVLAAIAMIFGFTTTESSHLGLAVLMLFVLTGLLLGGRQAPAGWWWVDALGFVAVPLLGPDQAAAFVTLWRLVSVAASAVDWVQAQRAVTMMLISLAAIPLGIEAALASSPAADAWVMSRLSGERPNEKGWESPRAGWTGQCGSGENTVSVVVAGGSSVGGAYQFANEPEAFFTAIAHRDLCEALPANVSLRTLNFGDGDRNTFTISRTLDDHLKGADILVLYVGVNDIFTTQNTLTRKQRETRQRARSESTNQLMSWVSSSRLAVGASLWLRPSIGTADVADVPLADATENHQRIIAEAREAGTKVLLMTEYVHQSQQNRLADYSKIQDGFSGDDVRWIDVRSAFSGIEDSESLADRNHLSRSGNQVLGRFLADALMPWLSPHPTL